MKTTFVRFCAALVFCASAAFVTAGDFQSAIIMPGSSLPTPINVPDNRFLIIRNFTQDGGAPRGVITANLLDSGLMANVLAAAIVDPALKPEVINNVVIAGPATVTVTCGTGAATSCVLTYRKGND